ncbi:MULTISPECIES: hypothetical protein [Sphingobium]|uniref:Uncharacterized protein n=1 Tax=Sphingobium tyrosinilyticum TaxID=2715436 RepID=A0ABV9F5T8_9SPHN|nr:hypothetical protein [Sphingobium sp. EP60837]ANI78593.1 hypothetical protein EP837_02189 [Sphingobium sp. EP60837]
MTLHPQIAALAAQLEDLAALLRSRGDRRWSGRVELCAHLVADSNFTGVDHFLRLFEGDDSLDEVRLNDAAANARLDELRKVTRTLAERLAREEGAAD